MPPRRRRRSFRIVNLVATADLKQRVSLNEVGCLEGGTFLPERYACAYLSGSPLTGKVSVFESGKLISVGTRSESRAKRDLADVARILIKHGIVRPSRITVVVQNIVAVSQLASSIDLEDLSRQEPLVSYEPEVFPAAIWRPDGFEGTLLLFNSGKVICTAKSAKELARLLHFAFDSVHDLGTLV